MKNELERQLAEKFPFMKRGNPCEDPARPNVITNLYAAFGCEVADGWYSVIFGLCEEITAVYEKSGVPVDMRPVQIKEKFGTLRFCVEFEKSEERVELHKEILNIIDRWEDKSATVCEDCGKHGKLRTDRDWILTLCDECNKKGK